MTPTATHPPSTAPMDALAALWRAAGLPDEALAFAQLGGHEPVLPSSFAVGTAAQSTIAAAALAACELGHARGAARQGVAVDMLQAALECTGWFSLDGQVTQLWDPFSGLYRAADGAVRIHANFAHHRDGALRLLGLEPDRAQRADAEAAMLRWKALDFEAAAADAGLAATALRGFDQWDATPQGQALAAQPLFTIERIGGEDGSGNAGDEGGAGSTRDAGPVDDEGSLDRYAPPRTLPPLCDDQRPLAGVRVLDLTRILAGPVGGRALAAYGADVMLVNSPRLPNIAAIADTSRGKLSVHIDLRTGEGQTTLRRLATEAHVLVQGYRPGGLAALGFGPQVLARLAPGIVCVSLSAYGTQGPWAGRRGFDSLVQTAMGFNRAEGEAAGDGRPRPLPMQILDEASGYLIAFGAAAALWRQQREGGSWHVQVSLAQTGQWLRALGRVPGGLAAPRPGLEPYLERSGSGFGALLALRHSARLARTPAGWTRPSMPPGSHPPVWPAG